MPDYHYNVINPDNKALSGSINAPDEKSARLELNQLGFSIINMEDTETGEDSFMEKQAETEQKNLPVFEFAAFDKNKKRVAGTIQAEDIYSAYKRLIREYIFEVEYLVKNSLPEEEKIDARRKGVFELQNRLDTEEVAEKKKKMGSELDIQEFERRQAVLQEQVSFVLKKVKEILDLYETEIRPETKEKIHNYVDKILRIKNSTNLDYIRNTCEELLTFLQKEEIFLHEDLLRKEHTKMSLEAKSIMMQLHRSKSKIGLNPVASLIEWRREHILNNEQPSRYERFLNFFVGAFIGFREESHSIEEIRHNISAINLQIKQYFILYFQAPSHEFKNEAKAGLKRLFQERKKFIQEMKTIRHQNKQKEKTSERTIKWESLSREVYSFSGWLLAFYIMYYFVTLYIGNKKIWIGSLPPNFDIMRSTFLKYFFVILFLFHSTLGIKINYFRGNETATFILTPLFLFGSILVLLNF